MFRKTTFFLRQLPKSKDAFTEAPGRGGGKPRALKNNVGRCCEFVEPMEKI